MVNKDLEKMNNNFKIHVMENKDLGKTIKLYEMVHIAVPGFYELRDKELMNDVSNGYVVHHEGVQAPDKYKFSYSSVADILGMDYQIKPTKYPFEAHDATWDNTNILDKGAIKFASFMIRNATKALESSDKDSKQMQHFIKEMRAKVINLDLGQGSSPINIILKPLLINNRNTIALKAAYNTNKNVSMVWGKAHIPDFIKDFESHGFTKVKEYVPTIEN